ncbi:hypothetical protein HDU67_008439 [Dinochytrium kinnereticum]|nr:hypothetical protein HDU67_008439 [Dinochytrium kinnereticum]
MLPVTSHPPPTPLKMLSGSSSDPDGEVDSTGKRNASWDHQASRQSSAATLTNAGSDMMRQQSSEFWKTGGSFRKTPTPNDRRPAISPCQRSNSLDTGRYRPTSTTAGIKKTKPGLAERPNKFLNFTSIFQWRSDYDGVDSVAKNINAMSIAGTPTTRSFNLDTFTKSPSDTPKPLPTTPTSQPTISAHRDPTDSYRSQSDVAWTDQQPSPVPNPVASRPSRPTSNLPTRKSSMNVRSILNKFFKDDVSPVNSGKVATSAEARECGKSVDSGLISESKTAGAISPHGLKLENSSRTISGAVDSTPTPPVPKTVESSVALREEEEKRKRQAEITSLLTGKSTLSRKFAEGYELGDLLGDGAFGFVFTAKRKRDNFEVAVKFIIKSKIHKDLWVEDLSRSRIPLEVHILKNLSHPGVVRFIDYIEEDKYVLLVTELHGTQWDPANPILSPEKNPGIRAPKRHASASEAGQNVEGAKVDFFKTGELKALRKRTSCDLFECIDAHRRIPEFIGKKIFAQIALAIKYLHENRVVHRDLKDENIVIDSNYMIKIVDFGSASMLPRRREDYFTKFNGTAHFASPEIARGEPFRGPEAELWSLGVLLFTIVYGENPFQTRAEILQGTYKYPYRLESDSNTYGCRNLIERLLCADVSERADIEEVLNHPWLKPEVTKLRHHWNSSL